MGPTSLVNVSQPEYCQWPCHGWSVRTMIRSPMIVLWLMNLSVSICYVGWLDQWRLHNRSRSRHFRWLMEHVHCCLVNLAVRQCTIVAQFEVLREPIIGSNFAIFRVLFRTNSRLCFERCLKWAYDWAIGPSPNRERYREEPTTLARSLCSSPSCTKCKISTSIGVFLQ